MHTGKDLGAAIEAAVRLKIATGNAASKAEIARHFEIRPPSLHDWMKKGTVAKDKIFPMLRYFSDVTGPEHWGMTLAEWPSGLSSESPHELQKPHEEKIISDVDRKKLLIVEAFQAMCAGLGIAEQDAFIAVEDAIFGTPDSYSSREVNQILPEPYPGARQEAAALFGKSSVDSAHKTKKSS